MCFISNFLLKRFSRGLLSPVCASTRREGGGGGDLPALFASGATNFRDQVVNNPELLSFLSSQNATLVQLVLNATSPQGLAALQNMLDRLAVRPIHLKAGSPI